MYTFKVCNKNFPLRETEFDSIVTAKSELWRDIAARIELGEIDDRRLVYGSDSLYVTCDGWTWSVDAA